MVERDKLFSTNHDVLSTIPREWLPLFKCLAKSVEYGELWYQEQTTSQYAQAPLWHTLLDAFLTCDPTIISGQLSFKPRFLLLPLPVQERFLKFLLTQSYKVADSVVKEFLLGIVKHVSLQEDTCLIACIRNLARQVQCVEQIFTLNQEKEDATAVELLEEIAVPVPGKPSPEADVIILDDSEDELKEPVAKRPRLDDSADNQMVIPDGSPRAVQETEDQEKTCSNLEQSGLNMNDTLSSQRVLTCSQVSVSFIEDNNEDDKNIDHTSLGMSFSSLKDAWHNRLTDKTPDCLTEITKLSSSEMHSLCEYIGFESMTEESTEFACQQVCTLSESMSYRNVVTFLTFALGDRIKHLSQNASRRLAGVINSTAQVFPKQFVDGVVAPCLTSPELTSGQSEILIRIVKEHFSNSTRGHLLHTLLQNGIDISDSKLQLLQTLMESGCDFSSQDMNKFLTALNAVSGTMAKNLKFSKLLLALVNGYAEFIFSHLPEFEAILDKHNTFLKKKIVSALNKIKKT